MNLTKSQLATQLTDTYMRNGADNTREYWMRTFTRKTKAELLKLTAQAAR